MKKLGSILLKLVLILLVSLVVFYFWASSPFYSTEKYSETKTFNPEHTNTDSCFSIMSYNIGWLSGMTNNLPVERSVNLYHYNLNSFLDFLDSNNVDVIAFQEIDIDASRSFNFNQLDSIGQKAGFHQGAVAVNWDKKYVPFPGYNPLLYFGKTLSAQAVLSNYEILDNSFTKLIKPISAPFYYNAFYLERLIQKCHINFLGTSICILNVHLEAFDEETRSQHIQDAKNALLKEIDKGPCILIGDFNSEQSSENRNQFLNELIGLSSLGMAVEDSSYQASPKKYNTYPSVDPQIKIDYIFYSKKHFEKIESRVVAELSESSDHLPILLKLKLK